MEKIVIAWHFVICDASLLLGFTISLISYVGHFCGEGLELHVGFKMLVQFLTFLFKLDDILKVSGGINSMLDFGANFFRKGLLSLTISLPS